MSQRKNIQIAITGAQIVAVLLVGLFIALGINAILSATIVSAIPTEVATPEAADESKGTPEAPAAPNAMVYNRNLFNMNGGLEEEPVATPTEGGEEAPVDEAPAPRPGEPTLTDLPFTLVGTMVSEDARFSIAYLLETGAKEQVAHVGDTIKDGVQLVRIRRRYVLFRRTDKNNAIEYLALDAQQGPGLITKTGKGPRRMDQPGAVSARQPKNLTPTPTPATEDATQEFTVANGVVNVAGQMTRDSEGVTVSREAVRQQGEHKDELVERMRLTSLSGGGNQMGVRVGQVPSGSMFAGLGLQPGDVITQINGRSVNDPTQSMNFLNQLSEGGEAEILIDRRGKKQTYKMRAR